ncbi:MAG: hypothetical protein ACE369_12280 [Roseovarius sp.]
MASVCADPVRMRALTLAAALVAPQAALAGVTAEEAWEVWTVQFEALGLDWEAEVLREGDALAVGPIGLTRAFPYLGAELYLQLPGPRFAPGGDGIDVSLPESAAMPFRLEMEVAGDMEVVAQGAFRWRMEDATVGMRQDDAGIATQWTGAAFEIALDTFEMDGTPYPVSYRYLQSGFDITQTSDITEGWLDFVRTGAAAQVVVDYGYGEETAGEGMRGAMERNDVETVTELRLPRDGSMLNRMEAASDSGAVFRHDARAATGTDWDREWLSGAPMGSSRTEWNDIRGQFVVTGEGLSVVSESQSAAMQLTDPVMQVAAELEADRVFLDLSIPLIRAVAPQDYALRLELDQFTLSEESWAQFFLTDDLPREAADIVVDLNGEMILLETLFDLRALSALSDDSLPLSVETLELKALELRLPDASVTGHGNLSFDHTDYETLEGFPVTEGQATFEVSGAQGLLDRMLAAGALTDDDAVSARMTLGMFTDPVDGDPGRVRSEISITADGQVTVNGQRVR